MYLATSCEITVVAERDAIQFNITAVTFVRGANGSQGSSVSIVTRLQAGKLWKLRSISSNGKRNFTCPKLANCNWSPKSLLCNKTDK